MIGEGTNTTLLCLSKDGIEKKTKIPLEQCKCVRENYELFILYVTQIKS